ncbi:MAG TPA: DUF2100 domain-containing protein [Methanobacteriaceae archaeon]|nr:DUF2100 domain-containing protein [Methanobacteriaceae archaeon]
MLKEAGKNINTGDGLKKPREGQINSRVHGEIMNLLLESEEFIYSSRPDHHLLEDEAQLFCGKLLEIREKIDSLLVDFGVMEVENLEDEVSKLSSQFIFLTPKANFKKSLVHLGVDPQRIVVAGVPLQIEDMQILNPKIPEKALKSINIKIEHVKNDLERKIQLFNPKNVLVVIEKDKAGEILAKRAEKLFNASKIEKESIKNMEIHDFSMLLKNC